MVVIAVRPVHVAVRAVLFGRVFGTIVRVGMIVPMGMGVRVIMAVIMAVLLVPVLVMMPVSYTHLTLPTKRIV